MKTGLANNSNHAGRRSGFTLVELLVVIVVLLIVMTLTLVLVNQTTKGDRIAAASRQVQSMLEGARDRALHAREPRGVRFIADPQDPDLIVSMVYIGAPGKYSTGTVRVSNSDKRTLQLSANARWNDLVARDLLDANSVTRIRIDDQPTFYTVQFNGTAWRLTKPFLGRTGTDFTYEIDLLPAILPNQEPRDLPKGVVIDVDGSQHPGWLNNPRKDIIFSPRGPVVGTQAALSHYHLLITSLVDVTGSPHKPAGDPTKEDPETIVTVTTQSGSVSTHSVVQGDPFRNAESGVETK